MHGPNCKQSIAFSFLRRVIITIAAKPLPRENVKRQDACTCRCLIKPKYCKTQNTITSIYRFNISVVGAMSHL